jgi:hypothetical protein
MLQVLLDHVGIVLFNHLRGLSNVEGDLLLEGEGPVPAGAMLWVGGLGGIEKEVRGILGRVRIVLGRIIMLLGLNVFLILLLLSLQRCIKCLPHLLYLFEYEYSPALRRGLRLANEHDQRRPTSLN